MVKRNGICGIKQRGFTLLEILIAVAVLSFGLLAIGSFQAKLIKESAYNKARGEAIALAQEKLDDLRNYTTAHELVGNLLNAPVADPLPGTEYLYVDDVPTAVTNYPSLNQPADTITGSNAVFNRTWTIGRNGELSLATVTVTWTDRDGAHSVSLDTDLTYRNPRGTADVGEIAQPLVDSPTGKAYLGDGSLTKAQMDEAKAKAGTTNNNDGTYTGDYDGDGDLELIVEQADGSGEVVLTLPDACKLEGVPCKDFVKISGSVYLDRTGGSKLSATDVFVLASDAAYCARWVPAGVSGGSLVVSNDLSAPAKSDGEIYRNNDASVDWTGNQNNVSDYDYFNYTCYLGGGWYGNIGLVLTKANSQDYACVGDPEPTVDADGIRLSAEAWKYVELAKRRVYRGMMHKYTVDANGDHVEVKNAGGDTIFWTRGIKDEAILPDAAWAERSYGHDFVISNGNNPTRDDCVAALSRPDANPDGAASYANLFHNIPGDFICFNEDNDDTSADATMLKWLAAPWPYLNPFDAAIYDARSTCPYDPSDPPAHRFTITGKLALEVPTTAEWGSANPADLADAYAGNINTSDGLGNCRVTNNGTTILTYECDYYVWEDQDKGGQLSPWSGNIQVDTPSDLLCAIDPSPTALDPATLDRHSVYPLSALTGGTVTANFVCKSLDEFTIKGRVTVDAGNDLSIENMLIEADKMALDVPGNCAWNSKGADAWEYTCTVQEIGYQEGYTGDIRITLPADYSCTASSAGTVSGNLATFSFSGLISASSGNDVVCDGPMEQYTISGTVLNGVVNDIGVGLDGDTVSGVAGTTVSLDNGNCSFTSYSNTQVGYDCKVVVDTRLTPNYATYVGQLLITPPPGYWCGTTGADYYKDITTTADLLLADVTCLADALYILVKGSVFIFNPHKSVFDNVGPGNGAYDAAGIYLGVGLGDYDYVAKVVTLSANMTGSGGSPNGTCTVTQPTATSTTQQWYKFDCITDKKIPRNQTWSGNIAVTQTDLWAQCQLGNYTNSYSGVPAGTTIDNAFTVVEDAVTYCSDYTGGGPWTYIPAPHPVSGDLLGLPWTPAYP